MRARGIAATDRSFVLAIVAAYAAGALIMAATLVSTMLWPLLAATH